MDLTIVVPVRNEEQIVGKTLEAIEQNVATPHHTLVVNDHSTDRTVGIVGEISRRHPNVKLVHNTREPGFANALVTGFENVRTELVVPVMGDMSDDPATIDAMVEEIARGYDVVCASRYVRGGGKEGGPKIQSMFSRFVGLTIHFLVGIPTRDVSNAFKLYRKSVIDSIVLKGRSVETSMELALKAHFKGYRISEVPTTWRGRTKGRSKIRLFKIAPGYVRWYVWAIVQKLKGSRRAAT
jgi:dolichol-phosphate mannosyltransferase